MNYQWFVAISGLFDWLLLSIALFVISGKLGWKKKWPAWVPGYRIYCLGDSVGLSREGMYCGVMDLLFVIAVVTDYAVKGTFSCSSTGSGSTCRSSSCSD